MLAVVKKPLIKISGETIPDELLEFLSSHYNEVELISDESSMDIEDSNWFQTMKTGQTPGSALKRYRKRANLSQAELAEKLGMVKQNISAMEKGSRGISKASAHKLAEIFQTSPARFI